MASSQDSKIDHNTTTRKQRLHFKPTIAPKSKLVLAFANELRQRVHAEERSHSDSEIYDDILSFRDWDDDIYDDILPYTALAQHSDTSRAPEYTNQSDSKEELQTTSPASGKIRGQKPSLLPKLDISKLFPNHLRPSSCEDIYDDVIVYRMRLNETSSKPDVPLKPSHLYRDPRVQRMLQFQRRKRAMDIEEIYDTTVSMAPVLMCRQESLGMSPEQEVQSLEELYIDPASILQDIAVNSNDEIEPSNASLSEPLDYKQPYNAPELNSTELNHDSALTTPDQGDEYEIEDFVPNIAASRNPYLGKENGIVDFKNQANHLHQGGVRCLDLDGDVAPPKIPKHPTKYATLPSQLSLPAGRTKFDPLPDVTFGENHSPFEYSDSEEEYEELTLYEDVQNYQQADHEQDYEDLDKAIIKALNLPEQMRGRATRLVRGREKKKLQRSIKRRRNKRSSSMSHLGAEQDTKEIENCEDINSRSHDSETISHVSETISHDSEPMLQSEPPAEIRAFSLRDSNEQNTPDQDTLSAPESTVEADQPNVKKDDELEDEPIPFGKSREVFEMLLDASGIQRIPSSSLIPTRRRCSLQEPIMEMRDESEEDGSGDDGSHQLLNTVEFERLKEAMSTELKEYQDAGILHLRSRSQIEEEIKNLTETAPVDPPPLPSSRKPRTRLITRSDLIRHKRMLLQRRHTVDNS